VLFSFVFWGGGGKEGFVYRQIFLMRHDVSEASSASEPLCSLAKIDDRHNV